MTTPCRMTPSSIRRSVRSPSGSPRPSSRYPTDPAPPNAVASGTKSDEGTTEGLQNELGSLVVVETFFGGLLYAFGGARSSTPGRYLPRPHASPAGGSSTRGGV